MKKYRVSSSEHFNLLSMYDKLKCQEIDMNEAPAHTYTEDQWNALYDRLDEMNHLMEEAYCVGAVISLKAYYRNKQSFSSS